MVLQALGFSIEHERVYRILLSTSGPDLTGLASATGLGEESLRTTLDALADRGVIRIDPNGITVSDPRVTLGAIIEQAEDELMSRFRVVSEVRSHISTFHATYNEPENVGRDAEVERIEGVQAVREKLSELSFFARSSVRAIQPGGPQSAESLDASRPLDLRALRRQMHLSVIHERSVLDDHANRAYLREMVLLGVHARVTDRIAERMIILDEKVAVVPIDPGNSRRGALVVRHPVLVSGLLDLFQRTWDAAEELPFRPGTGPATTGPSPQDLRLLTLLASGGTDESIAREFDISVRHLRRRIARLMIELAARSRFEAGAEAARRGWL